MPTPILRLLALLGLFAAGPAAAKSFEILESDDAHVRIAFTLGDYRFETAPIDGTDYHEIVSSGIGEVPADAGMPSLPEFVTRVALPPGTRPVLRVVDSAQVTEPGIRPLPVPQVGIIPAEKGDAGAEGIATPTATYVPDVGAYARLSLWPATVVDLGPVGTLRNLRTVPVHVTPFAYRSGELVVTRRVVFDVRFESVGTESRAQRVPVHRDPAGERLYERNVLNAEQSRRWRTREATPVSPALRTRALRRGTGPEAKLRIEANRNELVRVTRARLASAGWTSTPPIADLRLTLRDYHPDSLDVGGDPFVETPVGILIDDANGNDVFDGGDSFVFYAQDAKTQRGWVGAEDRYSWENVYWVSASPGGGTAMPERAWTPSGGAVSEPASFESWHHYEEQYYYYFYTLAEEEGSGGADRRQKIDHLFSTTTGLFWDTSWGGPEESIWRLPFEIHDAAPGSKLGVRAEWRGTEFTSKEFSGAIYAGTSASSGYVFTPTPVVLNGQQKYVYTSNGLTLPEALVTEGPHQLVTQRHNFGPLAVNWFEIGYARLFRAHADELEFTNGSATGRVRWTIGGFTRDDVVVLDLATPDMPVRIDPETSGSGTVTAVFEDDVATSGRYLAQSLAAVSLLEPAKIELDTPSNLADLLTAAVINADYLVVVYDDFATALDPLIEHRRQLGLTPLVARVSDVYDEFAGGLFRPEAIRDFVRYCYRVHPSVGGVQPLHLLLVGDGSEDYYGVAKDGAGNRTSAPTYVPAYTVIGTATDRGASRPLIASDHWFIANPDASGSESDVSTSMLVGRLPVGSVAETEAVVDKILRYEDDYAPPNADVDQPWRRRGLAIADDCYSGGLDVAGGAYAGHGSEKAFETTSLRAIDTVHDSGLEDFEVETFFLTDVLDTIPTLDRTGNCTGAPACGWSCTLQYCRHVLNLDGLFISNYANKGHLFVTYQGHGNRNLVSHEYFLMGNGTAGGTYYPPSENADDVARFTNIERWPIWFFFACHVAEFCKLNEANPAVGDCLAERLLLNPEAGSIASIASSGFEWLPDNRPVHEAIFQSWFAEPYLSDPTTGEPGMMLGEIMFGAKTVLQDIGEIGMVESYVTLGDPALRIDIAPPRFKVWQDQGTTPWEDPAAPSPLAAGTRIRATSADAPTTHFAARVYDEVPIDAGTVRIGVVEGAADTTWVDPADYSMTSGPADPEGAVRSYTLSYDAPLTAADYELVFAATDYNARTMRLPLVSRVDASFFALDESGPPRPLTAGAFVATGSRVRAVLDSPVGLLADEIQLVVNGDPIDDVVAVPVGDGLRASGTTAHLVAAGGGARSFVWQLEGTIPAESVQEGSNTLGVSWVGGGEQQTREVTVTTTARFALQRYFAFPNPFESETDVFYRVSRAATRARVRIYTLTGRQIRTLEQASPVPDLNRIHWDGRDEEGDAVANGVYFFQLELIAPDGSKSTQQGKLARVVGHKAVPAPPSP